MSIELVLEKTEYFHEKNRRVSLDLGLYPDNTPVVNLNEAFWRAGGGHFKAIVVRPHIMMDFFTAMMVVDTIRNRGGSVKSLVLPYIPGARQDRQKWEGDWLETLRYVGKTINAQGFDKVIVADPHSPMASMTIDRMVVAHPEPVYRGLAYGKGYDGVIAPDKGAVERAESIAKVFKVPVAYGEKHRDPVTNKLSGFSVAGVFSGQHYLVMDDICDGGGTFLGLAEKIRDAGATADLFVTHGLFSKGAAGRLLDAYGKVYSTDSTGIYESGVNYINITEGMITQA